jgi:predicted house-cleaning NTP pyrophosphatase (Maf/HAM1 superfamily)
VVFLQAVCRYLQLKINNQTFDEQFYFSRDCLLTYADWMLENEQPYLEKPEILEYPNDTWTAQDLRKAHVLAAAAYFSPDDGAKFMQKAEYFENYVATKLNASETKSYTRILALLMQNQGAIELYKTQSKNINFKAVSTWPKNANQQTPALKGFAKVMFKRLFKLSIRKEIDWLKKRLA